MGRKAIGVAFAGVGVLAARALGPRLHARLMAGCERMFEQMPDTFPPKRMMRGIEEIRANSARTLALLEAPRAGGKGRDAPRGLADHGWGGAARLATDEERELATAGAGVPEHDRRPDA
jgi:hypothetical protein